MICKYTQIREGTLHTGVAGISSSVHLVAMKRKKTKDGIPCLRLLIYGISLAHT